MKYKFTYSNGVTQIKNLIPHQEYVENRDAQIAIDKEVKASRKSAKVGESEINALKKEFKAKFGENWFTEQSPLHHALVTGFLVIQDGSLVECKVEPID